MNIFEYIETYHFDFKDKIIYFLNNKDSVISGGFVRSLLTNTDWSKELDVIVYNLETTYKEFIKIFPPQKIEEKVLHIILHYENGYKIDLCKPFRFNDFSFNCAGLIGENLVEIDNLLSLEIQKILKLIDKKQFFMLKIVDKERRDKFKKILPNFSFHYDCF